ncbi:MAG: hypothetical protein KA010_01450 [Saprospiraceae bacterium]|nr:hypothetical protein [Saprospiraceae bacterium]
MSVNKGNTIRDMFNHFNKIFIYCIAFLFICCVSCNKSDDNSLKFKLTYQGGFEMQAGLAPYIVETHYFVIRGIPSHFENALTERNLLATDIKRINPLTCRLVRPFADGNYDFLYNVSIQIVNPDDPTDWKEIAYRENIQTGTNSTLDLFPTLVDVSDFLKRDYFDIRVKMNLYNSTTSYITNRVEFDFEALYE